MEITFAEDYIIQKLTLQCENESKECFHGRDSIQNDEHISNRRVNEGSNEDMEDWRTGQSNLQTLNFQRNHSQVVEILSSLDFQSNDFEK